MQSRKKELPSVCQNTGLAVLLVYVPQEWKLFIHCMKI